MQAAFDRLKADVATCSVLEKLSQPRSSKPRRVQARKLRDVLGQALEACVAERKQAKEVATKEDSSDAALSQLAMFTDSLALAPYEKFIHYVPRLVNVVTVRRARSGDSRREQPLRTDPTRRSLVRSWPKRCRFQELAASCRSTCPPSPRAAAARSTRRTALPQFSSHSPTPGRGCWSSVRRSPDPPARAPGANRASSARADTGRLVGTGTNSNTAARMAIMLAQRQLAREAGVCLLVRNFQTINTVGAASMAATFNCDGFASAHSSTSHYDRVSAGASLPDPWIAAHELFACVFAQSSFVGLAWRPPAEHICCGKRNNPACAVQRSPATLRCVHRDLLNRQVCGRAPLCGPLFAAPLCGPSLRPLHEPASAQGKPPGVDRRARSPALVQPDDARRVLRCKQAFGRV